MEQFTAGPWRFDGPKTQKEMGEQTYFTIIPNFPRTEKNTYVAVGFYYPHSVQSEAEMAANAFLISKAPALYEALKDLMLLHDTSERKLTPTWEKKVRDAKALIKEIIQ